MPYVPGSPIEAFCSACNKDTTHTVLDASGVQVRTARCTRCSHEGPYRSPKNKSRAALIAAAASRSGGKAASEKKPPSRRAPKQTPEEKYHLALFGKDPSTARPYGIRESFSPGGLISHPSFGIGIVLELPEPQKARVLFVDGEKLLACNRP